MPVFCQLESTCVILEFRKQNAKSTALKLSEKH